MSGLKQQIRELFEHWRKNTEGNDAILKSVRYRVFRLLDGYDIHPKGERVCIPRKQLEERDEKIGKELMRIFNTGIDHDRILTLTAEQNFIKKLLEESK